MPGKICQSKLEEGLVVSDNINKAELMTIMADKFVILRTNLNSRNISTFKETSKDNGLRQS